MQCPNYWSLRWRAASPGTSPSCWWWPRRSTAQACPTETPSAFESLHPLSSIQPMPFSVPSRCESSEASPASMHRSTPSRPGRKLSATQTAKREKALQAALPWGNWSRDLGNVGRMWVTVSPEDYVKLAAVWCHLCSCTCYYKRQGWKCLLECHSEVTEVIRVQKEFSDLSRRGADRANCAWRIWSQLLRLMIFPKGAHSRELTLKKHARNNKEKWRGWFRFRNRMLKDA